MPIYQLPAAANSPSRPAFHARRQPGSRPAVNNEMQAKEKEKKSEATAVSRKRSQKIRNHRKQVAAAALLDFVCLFVCWRPERGGGNFDNVPKFYHFSLVRIMNQSELNLSVCLLRRLWS